MVATVHAWNLTKAYPLGDERVYALNDVSLAVNPGEMVAILGGSSSGKSTLLHVLGCLQGPDSGQLSIEGRDVSRLEDEELAKLRTDKVGFVFQAFNLLPNETAMTNVEVALRDQELSARDRQRKALEGLRVVGLENRVDRTPGQIFPRQRQCVAIARALVNNPAVLFVDEPTRMMDSSSREEIMGLLQKLNDAGMTMVIATPDSGVSNYCHRVVRIAEGRTDDLGPVANRRIIPPSRILGTASPSYAREEVLVCPRCAYGNPKAEETCQQCAFPLHLTAEEEQSIERRLRGEESQQLGVESASDEGEVPGQELVEELSQVPFFAELASKSLVKVIPALEKRAYAPGSTIVKQGDVGDAFYIVRRGNVQVVLERTGRPDIAVAQLGPGEGFGEMALLADNQPRSASVIAFSDVEVWRLHKGAFDELLSENLSLSLYFSRIMTRRITTLQEKIVP